MNTNSEIQIVLIRYFGVFLSALISLMSIKVFLTFAPHESSIYLGIIGWLLFIPLFQFGYGRPGYALIRSERINRTNNISAYVNNLKNLYSKQSALSVLCLCLMALFLSINNNFNGNFLDPLIFALAVGSHASCNLMRDLSYATDTEKYYESFETLRRFSILLMYLAIINGIDIKISSIFVIFANCATFYLMTSIIENKFRDFQSPISSTEVYLDNIKSNSLQYFGFTSFEVIFYNIPLIIFTFFPSSEGMIFYSIWSKCFLFLALPYRIYVDTKMNSIITAYLKKDFTQTKKIINNCIYISTFIGIIIMALFILCKSYIAIFLGDNFVISSDYFSLSLLLWMIGNIIQHIFGSFTTSYGNGFKSALKISFYTVTIIFVVIASIFLFFNDIGLALLSAGIVYIFMAILYKKHFNNALKSK